MKAGGFLIGTPADIIEQLEAVEKRYPGLDGQLDGQIPRRPVAVDYARAGARGHHHPVFPQLAGNSASETSSLKTASSTSASDEDIKGTPADPDRAPGQNLAAMRQNRETAELHDRRRLGHRIHRRTYRRLQDLIGFFS